MEERRGKKRDNKEERRGKKITMEERRGRAMRMLGKVICCYCSLLSIISLDWLPNYTRQTDK